ncbi:putative uncharacterized protein [Streptomyces azureus]|uniref:Uncharacterized protein n=1 Tax=Streptomyces azureus TaxID=146537 RepID=A0A0K8PTV6_STRAJ|nr:putative uncharacterized protein [Streptomyces azureus]
MPGAKASCPTIKILWAPQQAPRSGRPQLGGVGRGASQPPFAIPASSQRPQYRPWLLIQAAAEPLPHHAPGTFTQVNAAHTAIRRLAAELASSGFNPLSPSGGSGGPEETFLQVSDVQWWGGWDSNPRPTDYESAALTG